MEVQEVQPGVTDQSGMGVTPETPAAVPPETQAGVADQQIDQESLSPGDDAGAVKAPQVDEEKQGLLSTIEAERDRRKTEASARQLAEERAQMLERQLQQFQAQTKSEDPLTAIADDEYLTGGKVKEIFGSFVKQQNEERQILRVQLTAEKARAKYGVDFDKAIGFFEKFATPTEKYIVLTSQDPGERAYRYGVSHPDYQKATVKKTAQDIADKVNQHTGAQKTLGAVGGGGLSEKDEVRRIIEMPDEEFDKMYNKVKYGG